MKPDLIILSAGIGSRYGGLKQIEPVGPNGEAIIEYSVFDAIRAGFGKIIFVINKKIESDFKNHVLMRFEGEIATECVFQEMDMLPDGYSVPIGRTKPWGTAHALMAAENSAKSPFCVINADDFYGYEAFAGMKVFLEQKVDEPEYALMGYRLDNTLSEFGSVSRGICRIDNRFFLESVVECREIIKSEGSIINREDGKHSELPADAVVSMNMWGFNPSIFRYAKELFLHFLRQDAGSLKGEFLIPDIVDYLIKQQTASVRVLSTDASWFGITYREDLERARMSIREKIESGAYPESLW